MEGIYFQKFPMWTIQHISPPLPTLKHQETAMLIDITEIDEMLTIEHLGNSLQSILKKLPESLRAPLVGKIKLPSYNGTMIVKATNEGLLLGASDGSVMTNEKRNIGGHSYSLRHWNTDENKLWGLVPTPYSITLSSLTTELLYGLLATTLSLFMVTKAYHGQLCKDAIVILTSDNEQAIKMASTYQSLINISKTLKLEYDIQELIHLLHQEIPLQINYQWVQDIKTRMMQG